MKFSEHEFASIVDFLQLKKNLIQECLAFFPVLMQSMCWALRGKGGVKFFMEFLSLRLIKRWWCYGFTNSKVNSLTLVLPKGVEVTLEQRESVIRKKSWQNRLALLNKCISSTYDHVRKRPLKRGLRGELGGRREYLDIYLISCLTNPGSSRVDCQLDIFSLFLLGFSLSWFCSPNAGFRASVLIIARGKTTVKDLKISN